MYSRCCLDGRVRPVPRLVLRADQRPEGGVLDLHRFFFSSGSSEPPQPASAATAASIPIAKYSAHRCTSHSAIRQV